MRDYISRRQRVQEKKNTRSALFFVLLTGATILLLMLYGVPLTVKYVGFLTSLKKSNAQIEPDDRTPPPPPTFEYIPESTKETEIEIKGFTEPGAIVILFINSDESEIVADNDGEFIYKLALVSNEYIIEAMAKDSSGNTSKKVVGGKVVFDKEPPKLEITRPTDGEQFFGSTNKMLTISGSTEPSAKVNINGRNAIVDSNGNFSFSLSLNEGENSLSVSSEDKAGNKTETVLKVNFSF